MPLYNDEDCLLECLIEENKDTLRLIEKDIKDTREQITKLGRSISDMEMKKYHLIKNIKTLQEMFKNYNKPR